MVRKVVGGVVLAVGVAVAAACAGPLGDAMGPATFVVMLPAVALVVGGLHALGVLGEAI